MKTKSEDILLLKKSLTYLPQSTKMGNFTWPYMTCLKPSAFITSQYQ